MRLLWTVVINVECLFILVRAVINETMRLFPPVPMNLRLSDNAPHAFPSSANTPKYFVPPNTVILYTTFLIQRRADLWGDDAHEFRPERWLEPETIKRLADDEIDVAMCVHSPPCFLATLSIWA